MRQARTTTLATTTALLTLVGAVAISAPAPGAPQTATLSGGAVGGTGDMYYLSNTFAPEADVVFSYGTVGDEVFVGDWDGNGTDTLAVRRGSTFSIRNTNSSGPADVVLAYGRPGDTVLVGDWDGDGTDTLAVRRGSMFHIKNSVSGGPADVIIAYGRPGDAVLVGDWDGDGTDTLAVRRGHAFHIKDSIAGGPADHFVYYGRPGDTVYAGDWDGNGTDTFGVRRGSTYYLVDSMRSGPADRTIVYGRVSDTALVGDWDGDGTDSLGVRRDIGFLTAADAALRAAIANDAMALARWASPTAAATLVYAFHGFYSVEGPFSIGECTVESVTSLRCAVHAADFPSQAVGSMVVSRGSDGSWRVESYEIWAD